MAKSSSKKASASKPAAAAARRPSRAGAKRPAVPARKAAPAHPKSRSAPAVVKAKDAPRAAKPAVQTLPKRSANGKAPTRIPEPVPAPLAAAAEKPKKVATGLTARDLDTFRDLLLAKRRELVGDMSAMEREALRSSGGSNLSTLPIHMADMGTDNYEQEFTLGLVEKDRNLLREINSALVKIQNGTYGICEGTGKPIGKARLEVQPWARFSIEYARQIEKGRRAV